MRRQISDPSMTNFIKTRFVVLGLLLTDRQTDRQTAFSEWIGAKCVWTKQEDRARATRLDHHIRTMQAERRLKKVKTEPLTRRTKRKSVI